MRSDEHTTHGIATPPKTSYTTTSSGHLEPRVAKLELGMERLTDDVRSLADVVRIQGSNMEGELQKLIIAVTQASGPRKTDWSTIIAAVMLIMAIGSAVFWPLNQRTEENKARIEAYQESFQIHQAADNQAVTAALIQRLEQHDRDQDVRDSEELVLWRQKSMGLSEMPPKKSTSIFGGSK